LGVPTTSTGEPSLLNFLKTFLALMATSLNSIDAGRWCYLFTVQLGTPRGRYDEYSSKVFPSVKKPRYVCQERSKQTTEGDAD
jgi:hypothetical protein